MIRIGIICPSEIAFRRFMPALQEKAELEYVGVACATKEEWFGEDASGIDNKIAEVILEREKKKAEKFKLTYGGKVFVGYENMMKSGKIDAIYLPLPPALHYYWAKKALQYNLHVFLEKPSTTCLEDTNQLIELAGTRKLALHENYMFAFHSQLEEVAEVVADGEIGQPRLYRIDFGFPRRSQGDFRYVKELGGGALLDCGGYTLKYANILLNHRAKVICANVQYSEEFDVELFGTGTLTDGGMVVQIAFGMDNDYRCNIDVWGSKGTLTSNRILTAPAGFVPSYKISRNGNVQEVEMKADDAFLKSMDRFVQCVKDSAIRIENYHELRIQSELVETFFSLAGMKK